ncbi:hypothetical protein ARMGADRAFT_147241 [Armillaria gallica]|uniref:Secreted protein n=1 Tax=Armillaria gallica TaxID=47427 RepID=A0A2H3DVF3_ARMGA|nr:hypothetical protein ARMGADRAFT_147241 [Armillaria gallica]
MIPLLALGCALGIPKVFFALEDVAGFTGLTALCIISSSTSSASSSPSSPSSSSTFPPPSEMLGCSAGAEAAFPFDLLDSEDAAGFGGLTALSSLIGSASLSLSASSAFPPPSKRCSEGSTAFPFDSLDDASLGSRGLDIVSCIQENESDASHRTKLLSYCYWPIAET